MTTMTQWPKTVMVTYTNPDLGRVVAEAKMNIVEVEIDRRVTLSTLSLGEEITLVWNGRFYQTDMLGVILSCPKIYPV